MTGLVGFGPQAVEEQQGAEASEPRQKGPKASAPLAWALGRNLPLGVFAAVVVGIGAKNLKWHCFGLGTVAKATGWR